ncbi:MAG: serine/threonine protein kinase, partial [Myxococcales bacterium]|nr:serine/threonine protein kinase [Myxococcales bacterium]
MAAGEGVRGRIGKYEIINRIGVGGMAELYVARSRAAHGFEKIVALKRLFPHFLGDDDFVRMFLHEARLAAQLHHPNIAQVYDIGDDDGAYFFTMEYVLGQDLRRVMRAIRGRGGWLTLDHIILIVSQIAAALHYAHEKEDSAGRPLGVVHRDVSPSNILISYDGGVKLVDFGIARATSRSDVTQAGILKGKIPYMSPEQCQGKTLDRRSDIYALGVVLWELALCRDLWVGENDIELAQRIASQDAPAPTDLLPKFPAELSAIIVKALARDRDRRYATAQEMQLDLEEFARERKLALSSVGLASFMSDLFADVIKSQKAALQDAKAGRRTAFPTLEPMPLGEVPTRPTDATTTLSGLDSAEEPRPRSRAPLVAAAIFAAAAIGAATGILIHRYGGKASAAAAPAASGQDAAPAPAGGSGAAPVAASPAPAVSP